MRRILVVLVLALFLSAGTLPLALAGHNGNHKNAQADVAKRGPQSQAPDMSADDDDGTTVGVQVDPNAGNQRTVQVQVTVDDDNGHNDIQAVQVTVYQPDNSTVHLTTGTAGKQTGNGKRATFTYNFQMEYHDPAGTYHVKVHVQDRDDDGSDADGDAQDDGDTVWATFEYRELAALSLSTSSITLNPGGNGSAAVSPDGDTHADPSSVTITNHGNVQVDLQYSGTDLANATSGASIGVSNVHWSTSNTMSSETSFSTTTQTDTTFDLAPGASASTTVYLAVHVPNVPEGTYTGTLTLTAVKG